MFTNFRNYLLGSPNFATLLLLFKHFFDNWEEPTLQQRVVLVWHNQIANTVQALLSQVPPFERKVTNIAICHALHDVFFNSACCRHDTIDHLVLAQIANVLSHATTGHIGGVAEEDGAAGVRTHLRILVLLFFVFGDRFVRETPLNHLVHLFDGKTQVGRLKASVTQSFKQFFIV